MSERYDDIRNKEGYKDITSYAVLKQETRKQKAFYVFKTMISVARLAGFYVTDTLIIEDSEGKKYRSTDVLKKTEKKTDV